MSRPRLLVPAALAAPILLASCVGLQQYHTRPEICTGDPQSECSSAYVEDHPEFLLGFIEFDDLGWAWEREQGRVLLHAIADEAEERNVLMVLFVHGWKHNAQTCDTNVTCFRETLLRLHATEKALAEGDDRPERRIVGIYVGWRGLSKTGKIVGQTSFYDRKSTAHKVGSGAVTELIVRLKEIRERAHRNARDAGKTSNSRLVVVGHSFGGALVYSATSQLMMDRLATAYSRGGEVEGLGDLVILVNPAFEAARFEPLHGTVNEVEDYPPTQQPVFAIFTSVGDSATGRAFPLGRFFSARKDANRPDERRLEQKRANRKAVGHFEPFRTHHLTVNDGTPPPEKVDEGKQPDCGCPFLPPARDEPPMTAADASRIQETIRGLTGERRSSGGKQLRFPTATLEHQAFSPYSPIIVSSVDDQIIQGHNDIYRPAFIDFLRYFIMMSAEESW